MPATRSQDGCAPTMTNPQEVIRQAVDGHAKGVAMRLGTGQSYVYKMMAEPEACRYSRFLQVFKAIEAENEAGANLLREDFIARTAPEVRGQRSEASQENELWLRAVAKAVHENSEAIEAAIASHDPQRIQKELADAIGEYRGLMRMVVARETASNSAEYGVRSMESRRAAGAR